MSVAGIDFGNLSFLIAQAGKGGVDVILNGASNRQTASAVSIQGKQRFIGDAGAAMARSNVTNTLSNMKLLVGRAFDDADVQKELSSCPFKTVKMEHGGVGVVINYNNEDLTIPVEHALAMVLVLAKDTSAKAAAGVNLADGVIGVPNWFTDAQRRAVLASSEIASLNLLKVVNEMTAIALSYGIFKSAKKLFHDTEPTHIMFVDIGQSVCSIGIVSFTSENMVVKSVVNEHHLAGRDFDEIIINFLQEEFQRRTKIDVRGNFKAYLKLAAAAEKAKKTLSPLGVSEAAISVECLANDIDLQCVLTRDEFEKRMNVLVKRLELPIERCLREADLSATQIAEVEIVGGSSRIGIVKRTLGAILGLDATLLNNGLKSTMNADEAVARGAALQCAMLSSRMKVKPFAIVDRLSYGINAIIENGTTTVAVYNRGDELPHKPRRLTFKNKTEDFEVQLVYEDTGVQLPAGESKKIGTVTVHLPSGEPVGDIRVNFTIDKHGCVALPTAQLLVEVEASPEDSKDESKADSKEGKEGEGKESKEDAASKKRYRKVELTVTFSTHLALSRKLIKDSLELEASMALEDNLIRETADRRNDLEAYLYSMRDKLSGELKDFSTPAERDTLSAACNTAEDWLYGDGFEAQKSEYIRKLADLKALSDVIEKRALEAVNRPVAVDALRKQMDLVKAFCANYEEGLAHIPEEDRDRLRREVGQTEAWVYDMQSRQGEAPRHKDPVLTCEMISTKRHALFTSYNEVKNRPKPVPVAPTPAPAPAAEEKDVPMEQAGGGPEGKDAK